MNYISTAYRWILLVTALLCALSFVPKTTIGTIHIRKIDLFSDLFATITPDTVAQARLDTTLAKVDTTRLDTLPPPLAEVRKTKPCPDNSVCIEDFTPNNTALAQLAEALSALQKTKRKKVRIAWFGDSFCEGDMITAPLRAAFQQQYGGEGVGYVPLTSPVAKLRPTIKHSFENLKTYTILDHPRTSLTYGFAGYTCVPTGAASVEYSGVNFEGGSSFLPSMRLFYANAKPDAAISTSIDKADFVNQEIRRDSNVLHQIKVEMLHAKQYKALFKGKINLYGASIESPEGVFIDNFALRGNAGKPLLYINDKMMEQWQQLQQYDLIILQYGLNVTNTTLKKYDFYEKEMQAVVAYFQRAFPKSDLLLIASSDRCTHTENGQIASYPGIETLIEAQRTVAKNAEIAFWDTRKAMGKTGGMTAWHARGHVGSDYTHLSWAGGKRMSALLYTAFEHALSEE